MKTTINREKLVKNWNEFKIKVIENTEKMKTKEENENVQPPIELSPKASKIKEIIEKSGFGCRKGDVAKICSEILGEEIIIPEKKSKIKSKESGGIKNESLLHSMIKIDDKIMLCTRIMNSSFYALRSYPTENKFSYDIHYEKASIEETDYFFIRWEDLFMNAEDEYVIEVFSSYECFTGIGQELIGDDEELHSQLYDEDDDEDDDDLIRKVR